MTSIDHQRQVRPGVLFCRENGSLSGGKIDVFSGSRDDDILAHERACSVSVARSAHVGLLEAVPHASRGIQLELVALVHRLGCLLVVTTSDQEKHRSLTNLDALIVVGQRDFEVVDSVVEFVACHAIRLDVVLQQIFCILLQNVDKLRESGVIVLDNRDYILVAHHDLLDLLMAHHVFRLNFVTLNHVFEEGDIPFAFGAARACKHD